MRKKLNEGFVFSLVCLLLLAGILAYAYHKSTTYTTKEYSLSEISDGVYGIYKTVSSSVPADNYEMITLCCNGNIYTFHGDVHITYTDNVEPYVIIHDFDIVNGDDLYVYIPNGKIEFQHGIGV